MYVCVCVCACVYVSEKYIMFSSKNKKISIFVRMYTIVTINEYVCTCLCKYINNVYLNVIFIVQYWVHILYIYITHANPKFTKHSWREQVHRDLNIPPHPTQTPKFTKHTWHEQVHRDVNIPPTPPKTRSSRSIHDVSKFTGTLTCPPSHPNPKLHEAYVTRASS